METNTLPELFEHKHHLSQDNFNNHEENIVKILRYMPKVINRGIPEHFIIIGETVVEKTSFVNFIENIVKKEFQMLPLYVEGKGVDNIDNLFD